VFWLEIGPLCEAIANVVCNRAHQMLNDRDIETGFFIERLAVPRRIYRAPIRQRPELDRRQFEPAAGGGLVS
jgi:hypothetical protein